MAPRYTALSDAELQAALATLPGWVVRDGKLHKTFRFAGFPAAIAFMVRVAFEAERLDHAIAGRGARRQRIERRHVHLLLDDLDADRIVGRGTGDHAGLDREPLAQQAHATPGRHRIVGRKHDARERPPDVLA